MSSDDREDRALASGLIGFIAILVVVALLYALMNPAANQLFGSLSTQASDPQAQSIINEREQIWSNILYAILLLSGVYLIARSVFESGRGP